MEHVLNETKAKEIAKSNGINYKNHSKYEDDMDSTLECYKSALEAMDWKDERHAKEKQQLIDKVCEWIKEHNGDYISIVPNDHLTNNFYDDLRKAMEGE